jgi:hypothetical protein
VYLGSSIGSALVGDYATSVAWMAVSALVYAWIEIIRLRSELRDVARHLRIERGTVSILANDLAVEKMRRQANTIVVVEERRS